MRQCRRSSAGTGRGTSAVFASYHANKRGGDARRQAPRGGRRVLEAWARPPTSSWPRRRRGHPSPGSTGTTRRSALGCARVPSWPPSPRSGSTAPGATCASTPFVSFAMGGGMHWVGQTDGPPLAAPGQLAWDEAGIHAAFGIVAGALRVTGGSAGRRWTSRCTTSPRPRTSSSSASTSGRSASGDVRWGWGSHRRGRWQCRDGLLGISAHQRHHWEAFLTMLDHPDELSEPSLADPVAPSGDLRRLAQR